MSQAKHLLYDNATLSLSPGYLYHYVNVLALYRTFQNPITVALSLWIVDAGPRHESFMFFDNKSFAIVTVLVEPDLIIITLLTHLVDEQSMNPFHHSLFSSLLGQNIGSGMKAYCMYSRS